MELCTVHYLLYVQILHNDINYFKIAIYLENNTKHSVYFYDNIAKHCCVNMKLFQSYTHKVTQNRALKNITVYCTRDMYPFGQRLL